MQLPQLQLALQLKITTSAAPDGMHLVSSGAA
jgi:hypothetical protein